MKIELGHNDPGHAGARGSLASVSGGSSRGSNIRFLNAGRLSPSHQNGRMTCSKMYLGADPPQARARKAAIPHLVSTYHPANREYPPKPSQG